MQEYDLSKAEQLRRKNLADNARQMILAHIRVEDQDESSVMLGYRDYYMQISFSPLHPLMVICWLRRSETQTAVRKKQLTNELNLPVCG